MIPEENLRLNRFEHEALAMAGLLLLVALRFFPSIADGRLFMDLTKIMFFLRGRCFRKLRGWLCMGHSLIIYRVLAPGFLSIKARITPFVTHSIFSVCSTMAARSNLSTR